MCRRLLWLVPKWPFPPEDGARRASWNLLRGLTASGAEIDLLAIAGSDESVEAQQVLEQLNLRRVFVVRRVGRPGSLLLRGLQIAKTLCLEPRTPVTMRAFGSSQVRSAVNQILSGRFDNVPHFSRTGLNGSAGGWDAIVYDGLHPAYHSGKNGVFRAWPGMPPVIYRAHNREADIWERLAARTSAPVSRLFLSAQARLVRRFEDSLARAAAGIAAVSSDDWQSFNEACPALRGKVVPIGFEFSGIPEWPREPVSRLLFLGRLDWPPNREGLLWFLSEVWPQVSARRPDLELVIAGSGDPGPIEKYKCAERINFAGRVENVESLYRAAVLCLVPVFYGSGTRVKAIEASRFGRPCLSTAIGVEGIGLQAGFSYFQAEKAAEWIDCLIGLDPQAARRTGEAAWAHVRENFSMERSASRFMELIGSGDSGRGSG